MADDNGRIDKFFKLKKTRDVIRQIYETNKLCFPQHNLDYETVEQRLLLSCKTPFSQRHRAVPTKQGYRELLKATELLKRRLEENNIDFLLGKTLYEKVDGKDEYEEGKNLWSTDALDIIYDNLKLHEIESAGNLRSRVTRQQGTTAMDIEIARSSRSNLVNFIGATFDTLDELGVGDNEAEMTIKYFFKGLYPTDWDNVGSNRSSFVKTHCGLLSKNRNKNI